MIHNNHVTNGNSFMHSPKISHGGSCMHHFLAKSTILDHFTGLENSDETYIDKLKHYSDGKNYYSNTI